MPVTRSFTFEKRYFFFEIYVWKIKVGLTEEVGSRQMKRVVSEVLLKERMQITVLRSREVATVDVGRVVVEVEV